MGNEEWVMQLKAAIKEAKRLGAPVEYNADQKPGTFYYFNDGSGMKLHVSEADRELLK